MTSIYRAPSVCQLWLVVIDDCCGFLAVIVLRSPKLDPRLWAAILGR